MNINMFNKFAKVYPSLSQKFHTMLSAIATGPAVDIQITITLQEG